MQRWIAYGILTALFWGSYVIAIKLATSKKYFNLAPKYVSIFMLIGIAIVFIGSIAYTGEFAIPKSKIGIGLGILSGILWALGMFFSIKALSLGADIAKLAPIYNVNTLVAVLLGIIVLQELPAAGELIKVIIGALLIVVGAILVST